MNQPLKILHLEDLAADSEMVDRELKKANFVFEKRLVSGRADFIDALDDFKPGIVLSDHTLPSFDSLEALKITRQRGIRVPFILVTATVSEDFAVNMIREGASDYILKDRLQRLPKAMQNALDKYSLETKQQQFIEALIVKEALMKEAERQAHFGSWHIDLLQNSWKWSDETYRMLGYEPGETEPNLESLLKNIHPDDIPSVSQAFQNMATTVLAHRLDFRVKKNTGAVCYIRSMLNVKHDETGRTESISGFGHDITETRQAEERLRENEANLKTILYNTNTAYILIDAGLDVVAFNPPAETFTKELFDSQLQQGKRFSDFIPADMRAVWQDRLTRALAGERIRYELSYPQPDGSFKWYHIRFENVINAEQKNMGLVLTSTNITKSKLANEALRSSEQKYKLLFEGNPMPMWMIAIPDLHIIDVNESAIAHYGYSREEFLKLNAMKLRPEEDVAKYLEFSTKASSGTRLSGIWRHLKKDGSVIYADVIAHDFWHEGRQVRLVLSNDVTEKIKVEEMLKKSFEELRQLASHLQDIREEERASMAREIHDELGQQLTGIKIDISWLLKKMTPQENPQVEQKLNSTIALLDNTIKTVRKIATELHPSVLDDLGLLAAIEWYCQEFAKRFGIATRFRSGLTIFDFPPRIAIGLFRICQESLTNVARYSLAKNVSISLQQDQEQVVLEIADDGIGFDQNKIRDKKTLGLLGMKERALMMGGELAIKSREGNGTAVSVVVPNRMFLNQKLEAAGSMGNN